MTTQDPVAVVVLAAGASKRLGRPKQLVTYRGAALVRHAAATALEARLGPVIVVLGANAEDVGAALGGLGCEVVVNAEWAAGLGGSIAAGVRAASALADAVSAALIMTCDQPRVAASHLALLAQRHAQHSAIVASAYAGRLGVPALFPREVFPELCALTGDSGAKAIIEARGRDVVAVPCPDAEFDLDTETDLGRLADEPA